MKKDTTRVGIILLLPLLLALTAEPEGPAAAVGHGSGLAGGGKATAGRALDPVVATGSDLSPCLAGLPPNEIVGFAFQDGAWVQVPVQADERAVLDIVSPYGPYAAAAGYPPPTGVNALFYTDAGTYTGADPDPGFDADDELVWMAADLGEDPPVFSHPAGVVPSSGCRVTATDPGAGPIGSLYLYRHDGSLDPAAGRDYVDYDFDLLAGAYPADYDVPSGPNPEDTAVTTGRYRHHFSDRWIVDGLLLLAGGAPGTDLLDRHQNFFAPGNCGRTEDTFSAGEGCFVTNRDGPVRAIRSYMGANSGPLTQRTHLFYQGRQDMLTDLRVHEINAIYDVFDYEPEAAGATYFNDLNPAGLTLDGVPESAATGEVLWELLAWPSSSLVIAHDLDTDIALGAEANLGSYWEDDATDPVSDCTGDGLAYGTSGAAFLFVPSANVCTDPLREDCVNLRRLRAIRHVYYVEAGLTVPDAEALQQSALAPLTVAVEPVGECDDGDGDGWGDPGSPACAHPETDCDDTNAAVNPGAAEVCDNSMDDDCDGLTDAADPACGSAGWGAATPAEASTQGVAGGAVPAGPLPFLLLPAALVALWRFLRFGHPWPRSWFRSSGHAMYP